MGARNGEHPFHIKYVEDDNIVLSMSFEDIAGQVVTTLSGLGISEPN